MTAFIFSTARIAAEDVARFEQIETRQFPGVGEFCYVEESWKVLVGSTRNNRGYFLVDPEQLALK